MIIGVCGTVAAGKETLTGFLRQKGFVYFETSAILKEMLIERKLEITRENMQNLGDELRKKDGVGALMKIMLEKAKKDLSKNYLFDSLRNDGEAVFLRENCKNFLLIGVDAAREIRFNRIISRGKPHDPKNWEEFLVMDNRDLNDKENPLGQQTQKLLDMADFKIINDKDLESAMKQVREIYTKILKGIS
jgi:dephospho-CoA kinase